MDRETAEKQWNYCRWCGQENCGGIIGFPPFKGPKCPALMTHKGLPPMIPKDQLEHGAYYNGDCRNASIARWNAEANIFIHWRTKFHMVYPETIGYWVDAQPGEHRWDEFKPFGKVDNPPFEIPLTEQEFDAAGGYNWKLFTTT